MSPPRSADRGAPARSESSGMIYCSREIAGQRRAILCAPTRCSLHCRWRCNGSKTGAELAPVMNSRSGRCGAPLADGGRLAGKLAVQCRSRGSGTRSPLRSISMSGSKKISGWEGRKTVASVAMHRSISGEAEASNTPTMRDLSFRALTNFQAWLDDTSAQHLHPDL